MEISGCVLLARTSLSTIDANGHALGQDEEVDLGMVHKKLADGIGNPAFVIRQ